VRQLTVECTDLVDLSILGSCVIGAQFYVTSVHTAVIVMIKIQNAIHRS